ncbi:MAG: SDR family NAD(P)-dependent oxidoreductase, partial [Betaproteobacteria bacterium]|nr:SDR family NAD(P)-dependent oxidoreductase [Betaproteobacteria bacterium]
MPSAELKGKVAWVTGGGSGIGLAGAKELAAAGAHVVISGRTARTNDSALAELKKIGSAEATLLDVGDRAAVEKAAANIEKRHKRIDILVTSAGTNIGGGKRNLRTMSLEGWDDVVKIN